MLIFSHYSIATTLTAFLMFGLTIYSLIKGHRLGRAFALMTLSIGLWFSGVALNNLIEPTLWTGTWRKLLFVGTCFVPTTFFNFTLIFLKKRSGLLLRFNYLLLLISIVLSVLLLFHPAAIQGTQSLAFGYNSQYGPIGSLAAAFTVGAVFFSLILWWRAYRQEHNPMHRRRLGIIAFGFLLTLIAAVDFLPGHSIAIYPFGYLVLIVFIGFQAYAVYVYSVTQLQATLQTIAQRFIILTILMLPWFLILKLLSTVFPTLLHAFPLWLWLSITLLFTYSSWRGGVKIEHWIYNKQALYLQAMLQFLNELHYLKKSHDVFHLIQKILNQTLHVQSVQLILRPENKEEFALLPIDGSIKQLPTIVKEQLPWFSACPNLLLSYELENNPDLELQWQQLKPVFDLMEAQIIIPLVQHKTFLGLVAIGNKNNHSVFAQVEMQFLVQFQQMASIALQNAYFFEQTQHLAQALMESNEQLSSRVRSRTHKLKETLEQLNQLREEQNEFFTMASHTLRTPLTAIKAAYALFWKADAVTQKDSITNIMENSLNRLEKLTQDIVEIARMKEQEIQLKLSPIKLQTVLEEAYQEVKWFYSSKKIFCTLPTPPSTLTIKADFERLKIALTHVLSNAFRYTDEGDKISIKVLPITKTGKFKNRARIQIIDSGEGIPKHELQAIFRIFHQASTSHKRYQGHGLGLYMVKWIIEAHGGQIAVTSQPNQGTIFTIALELAL